MKYTKKTGSFFLFLENLQLQSFQAYVCVSRQHLENVDSFPRQGWSIILPGLDQRIHHKVLDVL